MTCDECGWGDGLHHVDCPTRAPEPRPLVCAEAGPNRSPLGFRYLCTEPPDHEGDHVARGEIESEGEYDRWSKEQSDA